MIARILSSDPALVALSFAWIVFVIAVGEGTRRFFRLPPDVTRKVVHVGVAFWALPTALYFRSPWWAAATPLTFIVLNTISYRLRLMEVIEEEGRGTPGTIYFPISFAALILVLWPIGGRAASVAGLFAMGFGDAAASIVGRRFGRHRYTAAGHAKSWEGTAVMFAVSWVAILLGTYPLLWRTLWIPSLGAAGAAALAEAPAGRGLDNFTVPVTGALVFLVLQRLGA
jgi:phytol kinase